LLSIPFDFRLKYDEKGPSELKNEYKDAAITIKLNKIKEIQGTLKTEETKGETTDL
jgi:hypothetical protein